MQEKMDKLSIAKEQRESLELLLELIKQKDQPTYEHSVRVGLLGAKAAEFLNLDPKALLYAGLLHDLGKIVIDDKILKKQGKFTDQDMKKIKKHSSYGYHLLKGIHDFSAQILLLHHRFGKKPYPKKLPESDIPYSQETKEKILQYAKILAIIDFYDAVTTRPDKEFGSDKKVDPVEVRQRLTKHFQDEKELIDKLYKSGIFEGVSTHITT